MFNFPFQETSTLIPPKSLNNKQNNVQTPVYSRSKVFCKKGVLNNFGKLTGNYLCHILLFNKVAGLRPATVLKRDSGTGFFLCILRNF